MLTMLSWPMLAHWRTSSARSVSPSQTNTNGWSRVVSQPSQLANTERCWIEIAPIGYMRGRTLNNAFIVVDEAQNCTYVQLKMLLTRLGWHSTMVVTGDPHQSDLLPGISGLTDVAERLTPVPDIAVVRLAERDIVRHPLVASMIGVL